MTDEKRPTAMKMIGWTVVDPDTGDVLQKNTWNQVSTKVKVYQYKKRAEHEARTSFEKVGTVKPVWI